MSIGVIEDAFLRGVKESYRSEVTGSRLSDDRLFESGKSMSRLSSKTNSTSSSSTVCPGDRARCRDDSLVDVTDETGCCAPIVWFPRLYYSSLRVHAVVVMGISVDAGHCQIRLRA